MTTKVRLTEKLIGSFPIGDGHVGSGRAVVTMKVSQGTCASLIARRTIRASSKTAE